MDDSMNTTIGEFSKELLSDAIYKAIRTKIIEGGFTPGEHLIELEIAKAFHTSQAPVREAFRQLQREGFIVSIPYKGNYVYDVQEEEIREIYTLRNLIEKIAVKAMFTRWNDQHSQILRNTVKEMEQAAEKGSLMDLIESDLAFHRYICRNASDYTNIICSWEMWAGKMSVVMASYDRRLEAAGSLSVTVHHHLDMIKAFDAANEEKLMQAFENHWSLIFGSNE